MSRLKALSIVIPIATSLVYLMAGVIFDADLVDDTYIFLRYAENLASGHGLVFNIGEYVEGFSSPLWMICLGIVGLFDLDLVLASKVLSALMGLAAIVALFFFGRKHLPSQRGPYILLAPMLFLATNPSFVFWSWSGMDTACFTFLFTVSFFVFLQQVRSTGTMFWSGTWFLLAAVARLDMLSVLPAFLLFILYSYRRQKRLLVRKTVSFLGPLFLLSILFLWRYHYYGSLLPITYYAKVHMAAGAVLVSGFAYALRFALAYKFCPHGALLLSPIMVLRPPRRLRAEWIFTIGTTVMWTGYVVWVGGDHFAQFRFFVPILPLLVFLSVSMLDWLSKSSLVRTKYRSIGVTIMFTIALLGLNCSAYVLHEGERAAGEVRMARSWAQVGLWLRQNAPSDATIASVVVGAIPYYSGLRTYDLLGLTDSEIAKHGDTYPQGRIGHQRYHTDYILSQKPQYIIYQISGLSDRPLWRNSKDINMPYSYALYDLANDERTKALYEYQAVEMENGGYIEFLQLKVEDP